MEEQTTMELSSTKVARMISSEVTEITEDWVRSMHGEIEARHDTYHRATSNRFSALEQLLQGLVDSTQQQQQHRAAAEATAKAQVASAVSDMKKMLEQVIKNQTTTQEQMSSLKQDVASLQDVVAANEKDNTTTNVSSLKQQVESVQKTVNTVEIVVANIELKCIQTNNSVKSLGTELSSFIEEHYDVSYVSPGEEDDDDDDSNSDDKDFEDDEEDGIDNANNGRTKKRRYNSPFLEDKWRGHYGRLLDYCTTHDDFPTRTYSMLDDAYTDFKLGRWVRCERKKYKDQRISDEHVTLLEQVPGWTW